MKVTPSKAEATPCRKKKIKVTLLPLEMKRRESAPPPLSPKSGRRKEAKKPGRPCVSEGFTLTPSSLINGYNRMLEH